MQLGLIDSPNLIEKRGELRNLTEGAVISTLTLDRVTDPVQLVRNMSRFEGPKILATLLPVDPGDDNPSRQKNKILYTRNENRIVPGKDAKTDRASLLSGLTEIWETEVEYAEIPYVVRSFGDTQAYTLSMFFTRGKK